MQTPVDFERIWALTKAIEQAAAVGEWEQAAALVGERSPLLMSLSVQQATAELPRITELRAIDARIAENAQTAQQTLGAEYRAAMQATRHASQYQRVAQF
jgi:flagellar protein FliT